MTYKKTIESIDKLNVDQYRVTQNNGTERPFEGEYDKHFLPGIYPDIVGMAQHIKRKILKGV